jgi:hypothetical protein
MCETQSQIDSRLASEHRSRSSNETSPSPPTNHVFSSTSTSHSTLNIPSSPPLLNHYLATLNHYLVQQQQQRQIMMPHTIAHSLTSPLPSLNALNVPLPAVSFSSPTTSSTPSTSALHSCNSSALLSATAPIDRSMLLHLNSPQNHLLATNALSACPPPPLSLTQLPESAAHSQSPEASTSSHEPSKSRASHASPSNASRSNKRKLTLSKDTSSESATADESPQASTNASIGHRSASNVNNKTGKASSKQTTQPGATIAIDEDGKPCQSYIGLIAQAILSSSERRLMLSDIYCYILKKYPYFNERTGWRNSIRHNLSLNDCFVKGQRSQSGKGHYWFIHPANLRDFMKGTSLFH